jgi:hypothetical protein
LKGVYIMKSIEILGEFQEVIVKKDEKGYYRLFIDGCRVPGFMALDYIAIGRDTEYGDTCPRFSIHVHGQPLLDRQRG